MTSIRLLGLGKKFGSHWLFRNVNLEIQEGEKIAVLGKNGSGKSTLLHLISGYSQPSEGSVSLRMDQKDVPVENFFRYISWSAPYIDLIEEFTPQEFLKFLIVHKPLLKGISVADVLARSHLSEHADQYIKNFSSGMKQRLKLAVAVLADTPVVLLDEPLSNLDDEGTHYYRQLITGFTENRIIIICSNNSENEISVCTKRISIHDYSTDSSQLI